MLKKALNTVSLYLILCIFITSCGIASNSKNTSKQNADQISKTIEYLCSDVCGGRQPGTEGNAKAEEYILERFKEINLKPLGEDYKLPYKSQTAKIDNINMELFDNGKSIHRFSYGKDYVEISLDDIDVALPLYSKPADTDYAALVENILEEKDYEENSHTKMIIVKTQGKYSKPSYSYGQGEIPKITVTDEAFKILHNNVGKTIKFNADINIHEDQQNNIAGIIEGQDRSCALLISAHFDHIGSIGEAGSSNYIIWRGALDNASGVSTMLEIAKCLCSRYKDNKPPLDIIFCAFNGEERMNSGNCGSSYFLEYIKEKYSSVFDINIDCLGSKNTSNIYINVNNTDQSNEAAEKITDNLKKQGINVEPYGNDYSSDHITFPHALCFTTDPDSIANLIHTVNDTPDKIDTTFLSQAAEKIANCIYDTINTLGIDKMTLPQESDDTNNLMTISDFEKRFNCKLDFLDFLDPKRASIQIFSRTGLFDMSIDTSKIIPKNISDIRYFNLISPTILIDIFTCKTTDPQEMHLRKRELEANEIDDKSKAEQININGIEYYIFTHKDKTKTICCEFEGKDILIDIHISMNTEKANMYNTPEKFQEYLEKNKLEDIINGMVELFKERG